MRRVGILYFIFFIVVPELSAQFDSSSIVGLTTTATMTTAAATGADTSEIPQGVIYVRKASIVPYIKVEYKYYLSSVSKVKVNVPVDNGVDGNIETKDVYIFDSTVYSRLLKRKYPKKSEASPLLSKVFVENMTYRYNVSDTPRVDTMVVGMWIDRRGMIERVIDDPEYTLKMPEQMVRELTKASQKVSGATWGERGGYFQTKKLFRKAPLVIESYYCEVFVIVSSYPLTLEQKITRYSAFDYPLNSPPVDEQQKASMEKNAMAPVPVPASKR